LSKPVASRAWVRALCVVSILAIVALASFVLLPVRRSGAGTSSAMAIGAKTLTPAAQSRIRANYASLPLAFEQNQGQTDSSVKYMARCEGYTLFLTGNEAVFALHSGPAVSALSPVRRSMELQAVATGQRKAPAQTDSNAAVHMQLAGGNLSAMVSAGDPMPGKSNYFVGNDPSLWRTNVTHYARVSYQDVYPGVNLAFHGAQRQTEFDFVVAPGANPAPIALRFTGAQQMKTDDSGNLVVGSATGNILLHKPVAYQEQNGLRHPVDARFVLTADNQAGFELGNYDRSRELVIDPAVTYLYSTYLGGSGNDSGLAIAFDSNGNAYVTGETASTNFPGASNTLIGNANAFVTEIAPNGTSQIYSTYIGGHGPLGDSGNAIAVDGSGNAFVAGGTTSSDFPTTSGVFQPTLASGASVNAFVLELGSGGALTYSTYLGGTSSDAALGIALATDGSGDVLVVGEATSTNFPTTTNPLQGYLTGSNRSGFVTKLNSSASALVYSTYLGGSATGDLAGAVAVDAADNAYVTGLTYSATFTTTAGAFQTACGSCSGGNSNGFVSVINPAGSAYVYSTYLCDAGSDACEAIAVDSSGSAYVTGSTTSAAFPVTTGAAQTSFGGATDAYVTKFNPSGSALAYSTFLGGSGIDAGASIALDGSDNAYVTGQTASSGASGTPFPTANATQSAYGGGTSDAFVSVLNPAGTQLLFSTFLGGSGEDDPGALGGIAVDTPGANIYVTGTTTSTDFPINGSVFQASAGGGSIGNTDGFVATYSQAAFSLAATTPASVNAGMSSTSTVTLTALNGYSVPGGVTLTCNVTGATGATPLPTCGGFSTNPVTPTAMTTLTINTTAGVAPGFRTKAMLGGMWLPIAGLTLVGVGFSTSRSRRKKMLSVLMMGMLVSTLILMPACGGGSSSTVPPANNTCAAAPSVPTGLAASGTTSSGTTLNWAASTAGANCTVSNYTVYQTVGGITTTISSSTNSLNVTGLTAGTMYSFTVAANDAAGASAQSSPVNVTTLSSGTPSGNYTITITGTDANNRSQTATVTLVVN
jgi:hypothetical protein